MSDNAAKPYSADPSSSAEKEDEDHITVPMARIGKAFTPGAVTPTTPVQPTQAPTQKPTQAPTQAPTQKPNQAPTNAPTQSPSNPQVTVRLGDVDNDGYVLIFDATLLQRYLVDITVAVFNEEAADVDGDGTLTIMDATFIQHALVDISVPYDIQV
jgi:hypothetical protein